MSYRIIKSPDYVTIANYHLRDKRLTMAAKGLLSMLLADEGDGEYTIAELAERGPEGKDAVRSALRRLEETGYIRRRQTHGEDGRFAGNDYDVFEAPSAPLSENPTTVEPLTGKPTTVECLDLDKKDIDNSDRSLHDEAKRKKKNPPKSPPGSGAKWKPERFAAFWSFYSHNFRGESKQAAMRAWDKLRPDDDLIAVMGRALRRQMQTETHRRGIGISYASTGLNPRRWEDELPALPAAEPAGVAESAGVRIWTPEEAET